MTIEQILQDELSVARTKRPEDKLQLVDPLRKLAAWYCERRQPGSAVPLIQELWSVETEMLGETDPLTMRQLSWLASTLTAAGRIDQAETALRGFVEDVRLREKAVPEDQALLLNQLVELYYKQSKMDDALQLCRQTLKMFDHDAKSASTADRPDRPVTPQLRRARNNLGALLVARGEYDEAQRVFLQNLREAKTRLAPGDPALIGQLANLAAVLRLRGRIAQSERLTIRAVRRCQQSTGWFHPLVAQGLSNLGTYRLQGGRPKSAASLFRKVLRILKRLYPTGHPQIAKARRQLAEARLALGNHLSAEKLLERTRMDLERGQPVDEIQLAQTMCSLGFVYLGVGRLANSERTLLRALEIQERRLGSRNSQFIQTLNGLGCLYAAKGNLPAATDHHQRALDLAEKHFGINHPELAKTLIWIGEAALAEGRLEDARTVLERALKLRETHLGKDHLLVAEALVRCGQLALAEGRPSRALSIGARANAIFNRPERRANECPPLARADVLAVAAEASRRLKRFRGAETLTDEELKLRETVVGRRHVSLLPALRRMAAVCLERELYEKAEKSLRRGMVIAEKTLDAMHHDGVHFAENLGRLYARRSKFDEAGQWMERAVKLCQRCFGDQADQVADTMLRCSTYLRTAGRDGEADSLELRAIDLRNRNCHVLL